MEKQSVHPIEENLWWVIPGKLAGVRKPNPEEIAELQAAGVGAIISVMDDPSNLDLYQAVELQSVWLPIHGGSFPSQEQLQKLRHFVDEQNWLGHGVAVHCTNGRRRTGTMLAAYLIGTGLTFDQAMEIIRAANSQIELREAQIAYLKALAAEKRSELCPNTSQSVLRIEDSEVQFHLLQPQPRVRNRAS